MKEPEKPKKPERKPMVGPGNVPPEMVEAPCECGCCPAHGEEAQGRPLSEKEYRHLAVGDPFGEHGAPNARHENAAGKKMCGTCGYKIARQGGKKEWYCTHPESFLCPAPHSATGQHICCPGFTPKPRKPRPSQAKPERVVIPAGTRFIYLGRARQGERHQGVMTVAYSVDEKNREVKIGFSFCSPKDPWVKAKGQSIALDQIVGLRLHAPYLYEPKREVVEIAQALMEHRWDWLKYYCARNWPGGLVIKKVPCWSKALARRLKTRKVSGISRLKLFERRSFPFPIPTTDSILRAMVQDILTLGGKP